MARVFNELQESATDLFVLAQYLQVTAQFFEDIIVGSLDLA
jgi:formyltetrahydrofolate hydrolase